MLSVRVLAPFFTAAALLMAVGPLQAGSKPRLEPSGKPPACVLTLEVRQDHWTLDPVEIAKDHFNALQFDVPADRGFCESVAAGTVLNDKFRWGSWFFRQSYGTWTVRVVGKQIDGVTQGSVPVPVPVPAAIPADPPPRPAPAAPVPAAPLVTTSPRVAAPAAPFLPGKTPGVDDPLPLQSPTGRPD